MGLNEVQKKERSEFLEKNLKITECSQRKPYVFISYASDNWEAVFKSAVVPMQKKYGLRVYADKAFDKVNDKWIVPMLRNVRGADVVIAFISQSYIESYACFLELLTAVNNRKQVVFVSLEEHLHLGDTTDQPVIERGVKNEILNQGANIATNTNNTSNDIMRAMKSSFTSLSTLLEQDALSRYDISDAFINFFRDASINRKSINDLKAVRGTIRSVSSDVFDKSLITESQPEPAQESAGGSASGYRQEPAREPDPESGQEPAPVLQAGQESQPERKADFSFTDNETEKKTKKALHLKLILGGIAVAVAVLVIVFIVRMGNVTDKAYTTPGGTSGTYTGQWKKEQPEGQGTFTGEDGTTYEGEWKEGEIDGQGTACYTDGSVYEGGFKDDLPDGQGKLTYADGSVYKGGFSEGEKHGDGVYTTVDGVEENETWVHGQKIETVAWDNGTYTGTTKDGTPHGSGTITYPDGSTYKAYEGEWEDGRYHGQGTLSFASGSVYEGEFEDGNYSGQGIMTYYNGVVYEGEWKDNKYQGQGTLTYADGSFFQGEFKEGVKDGDGIYTKTDGTTVNEKWVKDDNIPWDNGVYTGPTKDGTPNGNGTITFKDGSVYKGALVNGLFNGKGTMTYANGDAYEGEWKSGSRGGQGVYTYANGNVYEGEWADNSRNGQGKLTYANGDVLEGEWKDSLINGQGKLTFANGDILEGEFKDGKEFNCIRTNADGTVVKWENGEKVED